MFFIMLSHVISVCLCESVAKILVQSFHSCCVVRDWLWFLWVTFDAELHSQVSFCNCKEWCYRCCNVNAVIVEELDHDKKMNSIILNIIAVRLKISLKNLILSFNLIINVRMKCNAKFSLNQKMIAQWCSKVWCKYEISVKNYIIKSFVILNYFVKKKIDQIESNHCLSSRNVVRHLEKTIDYNHNAVVEVNWLRQVEYLSSSQVLDSKSVELNWNFFEKVSSWIEKLNLTTWIELRSLTQKLNSKTWFDLTRY